LESNIDFACFYGSVKSQKYPALTFPSCCSKASESLPATNIFIYFSYFHTIAKPFAETAHSTAKSDGGQHQTIFLPEMTHSAPYSF